MAKMQWFYIPNYTMKCRIYPNAEAAAAIDAAIHAVQSFHNCVLWDLFNHFINTIEKEEKKKKDVIRDLSENADAQSPRKVHFPDYKAIFSAAYKNKLVAEHPSIAHAPAAAITSNIGLKSDLMKELGKLPLEYQKPNYYNKSHPRRSYTYQETYSKIVVSESNPKVFFITLAKVGAVKVRGWNPNIRFEEDGTLDFLEYAMNHPKERVTVTVSKDNCGDYFLCFKLSSIYKQFAEVSDKQVGVDVGLRHIAIQSDGKKYPNKRYKEAAAEHHTELNQRMSRRQGWANPDFRKAHKKDPALQVSKTYERTKLKLAKLDRKTARKRANWNHQVSHDIVAENGLIAVETLSVRAMFQDSELANALSDAAMADELNMLAYKAGWYGRDLRQAEQHFPSTQICNRCGFQNTKLRDSLPETWVCPCCGVTNDIDINAAKNLLDHVLEEERKEVV